ncbi:protein of unknown function [Methylotuvimicrobium alcaliphilum 20Z]|uniref:HTH-like domain-containing protein n=1 Tax=Methylotuvimicrobium alcaliphilum (strain DSM 19304 / NCIMB 14124 / VKM B-2133 / 20Z) TaxID=1091494 RepID=G4SYU1_META2|nr:protein of unknown function [Methylotuvimicrobium alcaliphilum 20Z]
MAIIAFGGPDSPCVRATTPHHRILDAAPLHSHKWLYAVSRCLVFCLRLRYSRRLRQNTRRYGYRGLKIFTSLTLRFQDFQRLMHRIDALYTDYPFYGSRRMTAALRRLGYRVNRKRIRGLMAKMGLEAIYPKPNTSQSHPEHRIYPYLLNGVKIDRIRCGVPILLMFGSHKALPTWWP